MELVVVGGVALGVLIHLHPLDKHKIKRYFVIGKEWYSYVVNANSSLTIDILGGTKMSVTICALFCVACLTLVTTWFSADFAEKISWLKRKESDKLRIAGICIMLGCISGVFWILSLSQDPSNTRSVISLTSIAIASSGLSMTCLCMLFDPSEKWKNALLCFFYGFIIVPALFVTMFAMFWDKNDMRAFIGLCIFTAFVLVSLVIGSAKWIISIWQKSGNAVKHINNG